MLQLQVGNAGGNQVLIASVPEALNSDLSVNLTVIRVTIQKNLKISEQKALQIASLAFDCIKRYRNLVTVRAINEFSITVDPLPQNEQDALEAYFDEQLLRFCVPDLAEKVKYFLVKFFYFQTGAFGKYALTIESIDKMLIVSAGPLRGIKSAPKNHEIHWDHPLLSSLLGETTK